MTSPFSTLYSSVQARIATHLPDIYTDQDLGQLLQTSPPVSWPCALIDIDQFSFEALGEGVQQGKGTIIITLAFLLTGSSASSISSSSAAALAYYETEQQLHQALQNWSPTANCGPLNRASCTTVIRKDNIRVREIKYTVSLYDDSTRYTQRTAPFSKNIVTTY